MVIKLSTVAKNTYIYLYVFFLSNSLGSLIFMYLLYYILLFLTDSITALCMEQGPTFNPNEGIDFMGGPPQSQGFEQGQTGGSSQAQGFEQPKADGSSHSQGSKHTQAGNLHEEIPRRATFREAAGQVAKETLVHAVGSAFQHVGAAAIQSGSAERIAQVAGETTLGAARIAEEGATTRCEMMMNAFVETVRITGKPMAVPICPPPQPIHPTPVQAPSLPAVSSTDSAVGRLFDIGISKVADKFEEFRSKKK